MNFRSMTPRSCRRSRRSMPAKKVRAMSQYWGVGRLGTHQSAAYTGTAGTITNAISAGVKKARIAVTSAAYIKIGVAPTATTSDVYMAATLPSTSPSLRARRCQPSRSLAPARCMSPKSHNERNHDRNKPRATTPANSHPTPRTCSAPSWRMRRLASEPDRATRTGGQSDDAISKQRLPILWRGVRSPS